MKIIMMGQSSAKAKGKMDEISAFPISKPPKIKATNIVITQIC